MSMNCKGIPLLDRITVLFGGNYRGEWGDYRGNGEITEGKITEGKGEITEGKKEVCGM